MGRINIDHINVIRENGGKVFFESVAIPKDVELLSELSAMVNNPNRTVLDMQRRLALSFNVNNRGSFDYIAPYGYTSTFVTYVSYPKELTAMEYVEKINSFEKDLKSKNYADDIYSKKLLEKIRDIKCAYLSAVSR